MRVKVKLDEVSSSFEPVPADTYRVRVDKCDVGKAKGSGKDKIHWEFLIAEGEYEGQRLFLDTSLQPQALFKVKQVLEACGFEWDEDGFESSELPGSELVVGVELDEYEGKPSNKVVEFMTVE